MDSEFELLSSRTISDHREMTQQEILLYKKFFDTENNITDDGQIFRPDYGTLYSLYNEDVFINELYIREWKWKDYDLLEMTAIPDMHPYTKILVEQGESYDLLCEGGTHNFLQLINEDPQFGEFADRALFFSFLILVQKINFEVWPEHLEIKYQLDKFYETDKGRKMLEMDSLKDDTGIIPAHIEDEKKRRDMYMDEFKMLAKNVLLPHEYEKEWEKYHERLWQRSKNTSEYRVCKIIQWRDHKLIYVKDNIQYSECLYIVKDTKLILVFTNWYLMEEDDGMTDMFELLRDRVYTLNHITL